MCVNINIQRQPNWMSKRIVVDFGNNRCSTTSIESDMDLQDALKVFESMVAHVKYEMRRREDKCSN